MVDQRGAAVLAAIKREGTMGVAAAGGAGAFQLRLLDSPGLGLDRPFIRSAERRRDLLEQQGRAGGKAVDGSFNTEVTIGSAYDMLVESSTRGRWVAALAPTAQTITTTASTLVRTAGSWVTDGYKEGDVITITGDSTTANNNLRSMVLSVTALTMTVFGTPYTVNAAPRAVTAITRLKKVSTPTGASVQTLDSYTIEQYDIDIDQAELFLGERLTAAAWSLRPRAMSTVAWTFQGLDRQVLLAAASPYFTSPDLSTGDPMLADDAFIYYKGSALMPITGLDFGLTFEAGRQPLVGQLADSDIYLDKLAMTGQVMAVRRDLLALQDFDAETEFGVGGILRDPLNGAFGFYMPRVKIAKVAANFVGSDPAKVETRTLSPAPHVGDTDTDASLVNFYSSAA